jgi:hypothetical protein
MSLVDLVQAAFPSSELSLLQAELNQRFGREVSSIRDASLRVDTMQRGANPEDHSRTHWLKHCPIKAHALNRFVSKLVQVYNDSLHYDPRMLIGDVSDRVLESELLGRRLFGYLGGIAGIARDREAVERRLLDLQNLLERMINAEKAEPTTSAPAE